MSIEKSSAEVAAFMALKGLFPYMSKTIMGSEPYKTVRKLFAEADAFAAEADRKIDEIQAEGRNRYRAALQAAGELLSEHGLQTIVDDMREAGTEPKQEG